MAKKSDVTRTFNVAVVGLSGTEKEKGSTGVGKSCLCNRFIRPLADDYYTDHISVLSQTDFSGRVVNNDHFLYWGEVTKTSEEGTDFNFHVVEQTEFIDDSSFQPFKSGKTDPYYKRCSITKLTSAEKLMYICKNQLGIEKEYEQKLIPDGKLNIDGFICVFDVSEVQGRSVEKQAEYTSLILNNLIKTKKPIVLATTKNDEAVDQYIKEAERLVNRREYRNNIVIIETSAHENVNVELAFIVLAQMIDSRTKTKSKIVPFVDAARMRKEELDIATEAYQQLIRSQVTDYRAVWNSVSKKFSPNQDFIHYCNLFGHDAALKMFRRHVKKLKEEYIGRKIQMYIRILPEVLSELLPNLNSIGDGDWQTVRDMLRQHPDFNQYFLESPDEQPWQESDLVDSSETRIPFDLLDTAEAENCFEEHKAALDSEQRRKEMRKQFKQLLEETGYVTPGKLLSEVQVLFMGRECYESLSEQDLQEIYEEHQREITERAKQNFQELLLEHAELFYHFASVGPGSVITQEDINKITSTLQEDLRYKALDRLDQERMLMLLRHLGFVHGPIREHCPAFPKCMDSLIEKVIAQKVHRPSSWSKNSQWLLETENNQLNLVLLGSGGLAEELKNAIKAQTTDDIYEMDKIQYTLDFRIIDGDVGLPHNSFRTLEFMPHDICLVGCFCVYSNPQTLEYIRDSLEKTLLSNLEQEDRLPFHGLPIVILFAADASINEKDLMFLREEGQNRAKSLQCPFIDVSSNDSSSDQQFDETNLSQALQSLMQSIQRRASLLQIYHTLPEQPINPDIRIIMCMLCGDPYTIEHVLGPLLSHQCCFVTSPHTITLETYLGDSKRSVEVRVTSYHGANAYRDELVHGFILVYSTKRKASLSTLSAFSMNIPNIPIQILAVTETGSANAFFSSELSHQLITEGNAVADKLQAHFMTSTATCQQNTAFYTPFFKEVWEKKPQIEKAFHMEDLDYPIDGRTPIPPPVPSRQESYHIRSGSLEDGADSESLYEQLPMDNSRPEDEPASPASYLDGGPLSLSDDSDLYSSVYSKENGEHLVKPSRVKNKRSLPTGWVENRVYEPEFRGREGWLVNEVYHTYHTDRHKAPPPTHPKPGKTKQPKKLDLKRYNNLTDVIGRLSLTTQKQGGTFPKVGLLHAPLATPESVDLGSEYAQVKDAVPLFSADPHEYAYAVVHNALPDSKPQHVRSLTRRHPNREAFDKAKTKLEQSLTCMPPHEDDSSYEMASPRDPASAARMGSMLRTRGETEKISRKKEDKKKLREDEKLEKRRQKEEERQKRLTEKKKKKATQSKSGSTAQPVQGLEDFVQSEDKAVPLFVEKCIKFIEEEGLDSEGIYRVPGNRAHVELLFQKFEEDPQISIRDLDIPVNAVATALKDFCKRLPPLIPSQLMDELTDISGISYRIQDRSCRLFALRDLLKKLPSVNFEIIKFIFQHFVKVAENCRLNSMDSKNLAICWWPTLLPLEFTDMDVFERMRPHLEDSIQTMIDQFRFLFCGEEEVVMV
ncbi:rho GTPase-activating protein 190-like isoform X6 [Centruroides sculpturatus]|uniref:rho GTPase-activating protein 190-like isoform X6 n=1 Tax=Centruroides sculpturatus TaxID=218467 RepID=UPI000C6D67D5|nr:rho GTPase-activating protein 190-like isoform X6 [Centruroides sculpturatus]